MSERGVDLRDGAAVAVLLHLAGEGEQIVARPHPPADPLHPRLLLHLQLQQRHRPALAPGLHLHALQVEVAVRPAEALHLDPADGDPLDQLPLVGVHRVEPVDLVVGRPVRGGVPEGEQRVELRQGRGGLLALHLLRLVEDQDRPVAAITSIGRARLEAVEFLVDPTLVEARRVEGLHVDDHRVDAAPGRERLQLGEPLAVVNEGPDLPPVGLLEVLLGEVEGLPDALADGHAGHHHDELAPAVPLVQLVHRLQVAVRLPRAGLHLHVEVDAGRGRLRQLRRRGEVLPPLHLPDVLEHRGQIPRHRQLPVPLPRQLVHRREPPLRVRPLRLGEPAGSTR